MSDEQNKITSLINIGSGKLLPQIYEDLAKPSVIKVGKALETVLDLSNTILLPLKLLNERSKSLFKKNLEKYEKKLDAIDLEKIIRVPPEVGVPLIDKLTYTENETLSELFTNFLKNASDSDKTDLVHPSFVNILNNISIDEAAIMIYLTKRYNMEEKNVIIPAIDIYINLPPKEKLQGGIYTLVQRRTPITLELELDFPDNVNVYQDNLIKLGILEYNEKSISGDRYNELIETHQDYIKSLKNQISKDTLENIEADVRIDRNFFRVTSYGKLFFKSCDLEKFGKNISKKES